MSVEDIKRKVTALLAKARGTDNEAEAETFLAKAMELLQKHQLDIVDLVDEDDPIIHHVGLSFASSGHAWRWKLYSAVARMYGCQTMHWQMWMKDENGAYIYGKDGKGVLGYEQRLVGRESAVITTDLMYPWIVEQVRKAGKKLAQRSGMSAQGQTKRVAASLIARINRLIREAQEEAPRTAAGRNALVVMDAVKAKYDELYPPSEVKNLPARKYVTDRAAMDAANAIGLHRQTTGEQALGITHA